MGHDEATEQKSHVIDFRRAQTVVVAAAVADK